MTKTNPEVDVIILPAATKVQQDEHKILFVGQMGGSGTGLPLTLYKNIQNDNSWRSLFQQDSQLSLMIDAAKEINGVTRMDAIALLDPDLGTAAIGQIEFNGSADKIGTLSLTIGSKRNFTFTISVPKNATATEVIQLFAAAINGNLRCPVDAVANVNILDLTAVNKGFDGNSITLELFGKIDGLTLATFTKMQGGTLVPDVTEIETIISELRYQTIIMSSNYDLTEFMAFMDSRFNVDNKILKGIVFVSKTDSGTNIGAFCNAFDSASLFLQANKQVSRILLYEAYEGSALRELDTVISSQIGAIRGLRLTNNVDISRYVIARDGALDSRGGAHIGTKPYFNTPFPYLPVIEERDEWKDFEQKALESSGASILGNNTSRNEIIASSFLTTYKTDVFGNIDKSFKYVNYRDASDIAVDYYFNSAREEWAQSRLTDGATVPGVSMANEKIISAVFDGWYKDLAGVEFVVTRLGKDSKGKDPFRIYQDSKRISLDLEEGLVTISFLLPIVTQIRRIVIPIQLTFAIASA